MSNIQNINAPNPTRNDTNGSEDDPILPVHVSPEQVSYVHLLYDLVNNHLEFTESLWSKIKMLAISLFIFLFLIFFLLSVFLLITLNC